MDTYERLAAQEAALVEAVARGEVTFDVDSAGTIEAPPPLTEEPMVVVTLRLPPDLYLRLKRAADERGKRVTAYMREMLAATEADPIEDAVVRVGDIQRALLAMARQPRPPQAA
jgi:hypothetical protein